MEPQEKFLSQTSEETAEGTVDSAAKAYDGRFLIGDTVQLSEAATPLTDICLKSGESGVVVAHDESTIPWHVRGPRGDTSWSVGHTSLRIT